MGRQLEIVEKRISCKKKAAGAREEIKETGRQQAFEKVKKLRWNKENSTHLRKSHNSCPIWESRVMTLKGSRSKAPDVLLSYRAIGPIRKD